MRAAKSVCVLVPVLLVAAVVVAPIPSGAETIIFEPTDPATYVAGSTLIGVDNWEDSRFSGNDQKALVAPVSGSEERVLDGTQSAALFAVYDGGKYRSYMQRAFDEGTSFVDGMVLSAHVLVDGGSGAGGLYLNSKNATYDGSLSGHYNAGGFGLTIGGNITALTSATAGGSAIIHDTGIAVATNHEYKVEMVLDFTEGTYMGYYTDLTAGGSRTTLLAEPIFFYTGGASPVACDPETLAARGGIQITSTIGDGVAIFDNVGIAVPEPSWLAFLVSGLFGLAAHARRGRK